MVGSWIAELAAWWQTVSPEFVFLLALPFVVGAAGLLADCVRRRWSSAAGRTGDAAGGLGRSRRRER
jgi:hypothetical protein